MAFFSVLTALSRARFCHLKAMKLKTFYPTDSEDSARTPLLRPKVAGGCKKENGFSIGMDWHPLPPAAAPVCLVRRPGPFEKEAPSTTPGGGCKKGEAAKSARKQNQYFSPGSINARSHARAHTHSRIAPAHMTRTHARVACCGGAPEHHFVKLKTFSRP